MDNTIPSPYFYYKEIDSLKKLTYEFVRLKFKERGYELLETEYINNKTPMRYLCPIHGEQSILYNNLISGQGCQKCGHSNGAEKHRISFDTVKTVFKNKGYTLLETVYIDNKTPMRYLCPIHGEQSTRFGCLVQGHGCPQCNISKGEQRIQEWLDVHSIVYASQYSFNDLQYKNKLRFDFCIFEPNGKTIKTMLEYQGIQHYEPVKYFGGQKRFEENKIRDKLKVDYCKSHNIPLLRIKYTEFSILEDILEKHIFSGGGDLNETTDDISGRQSKT